MSDMIKLPAPQVLEIAGADAVAFAQAQFSNDVRSLASGNWQWSCWLSPQGRVRAFFGLLHDTDTRLRLWLRGGTAEALRAALAPYVLRAKVNLRALDCFALGGERADAAAAGSLALPGDPARWLGLSESAAEAREASPQDLSNWRLADIRSGLPELASDLLDQFLPQWLGLDRLGAISVRKGCYPGQEVMSRLHFKGGNKRSLYHVKTSAMVQPGAAVHTADGENAGRVVMAERIGFDRAEALASLADSASELTLRIDNPPGADVTVEQRFV